MLLYNTNYDIASNLNTFFNQINLRCTEKVNSIPIFV